MVGILFWICYNHIRFVEDNPLQRLRKHIEEFGMKPEHPFVKKHLDEEENKVDSFTIRLNIEERKQLEIDKKILEQPKDSTATKQLARIGSFVLHDDKIGHILRQVLGNRRRNKRLGIAEFEDN